MDALFDFLGRLLPASAGETLGVAVATALTLMVFSYLFGDNVLFRIAQHILIGAAAAYATVIATYSIIGDRVLVPLRDRFDEESFLLVPLVLGLLLFTKARAGSGWLGNLTIAFMLGVGVALSVSGVLTGTLFPQIENTSLSFLSDGAGGELPLTTIINNAIIVVGTLTALLSFHFSRGGAHRLGRAFNGLIVALGGIGRIFIWIAFGAIFAGLTLSRVTLLVSRVQFILVDFIGRIIKF
jgi:hypothetical protein